MNVKHDEMSNWPISKLLAEKSRVESEIGNLTVDRALLDEKRLSSEWLKKWVSANVAVIEVNDCSRLHRLSDALGSGRIIDISGGTLRPEIDGDPRVIIPDHTFVVKHDWLSAFGSSSEEFGDDFILPFPICSFEFRINGAAYVLIAIQKEGGELVCAGFVESLGWWACLGEAAADMAAGRFAYEQVRAICIALDAEVAVHEVVHAPIKLNEKRVRSGRPPIADHHVVDLSRRHRAACAHGSDEPKSRKRLHFRRGHWRHFEGHKTWIKWMLVGDPDLGFIHKHYSL